MHDSGVEARRTFIPRLLIAVSVVVLMCALVTAVHAVNERRDAARIREAATRDVGPAADDCFVGGIMSLPDEQRDRYVADQSTAEDRAAIEQATSGCFFGP